jgi:hypothetical protein
MAKAKSKAVAAAVVSVDSSPTTSSGITVITYESQSATAAGRGATDYVTGKSLNKVTDWAEKVVERRTTISPETLQANLSAFLNSMQSALTGIPNLLGPFEVGELELTVEVGAEGQIGLLGTGGKLSGKGSITLKLKKSPGPGGSAGAHPASLASPSLETGPK